MIVPRDRRPHAGRGHHGRNPLSAATPVCPTLYSGRHSLRHAMLLKVARWTPTIRPHVPARPDTAGEIATTLWVRPRVEARWTGRQPASVRSGPSPPTGTASQSAQGSASQAADSAPADVGTAGFQGVATVDEQLRLFPPPEIEFDKQLRLFDGGSDAPEPSGWPCRSYGNPNTRISPGSGPHFARIDCPICRSWRWMPKPRESRLSNPPA